MIYSARLRYQVSVYRTIGPLVLYCIVVMYCMKMYLMHFELHPQVCSTNQF